MYIVLQVWDSPLLNPETIEYIMLLYYTLANNKSSLSGLMLPPTASMHAQHYMYVRVTSIYKLYVVAIGSVARRLSESPISREA
jgi:hypothetical protein